ncbi:MAG: hypothetical protein AB7U82_34105 [Blastocatellales bacterium]
MRNFARRSLALALDGRTAFAAPSEITATLRQGFVSWEAEDGTRWPIELWAFTTNPDERDARARVQSLRPAWSLAQVIAIPTEI